MKARRVRALERHGVPASLAEERRLYPRYEETGARPPATTTKRQYIVELSCGINLPSERDLAPGLAESFIRRGLARRARVLRVTTITTTEVVRDFRALRDQKARQADDLHATAGKNGRPELKAVTP